MTAQEWIAQIFGFIAILSSIVIYSRKTRKRLLLFKAVQDVCWLSHYLLLSAFSAAATSGLCICRAFVFYNSDKKFCKSKLWLPAFLVLYALSAVLTWKSTFSILPAISSSISSVAFWMKDPRMTKLLAICAALCTLAYNVAVAHSPSVYVGVTFTISTSLLSLLLPLVKRKKAEERDPE